MKQVKRYVVRLALVATLFLSVTTPLLQKQFSVGRVGGMRGRPPITILCDGDPGTCPCPNC